MLTAIELQNRAVFNTVQAMSVQIEKHRDFCDCSVHRTAASQSDKSGLWSAIVPVLACAVCPACLTMYAKLLSVAGVGFQLSEGQHLAILVVAIASSVGMSAWRGWRTKRSWPISVALAGSALVMVGHLIENLHTFEWAGMAILLAGGLTEHFRFKRLQRSVQQQA